MRFVRWVGKVVERWGKWDLGNKMRKDIRVEIGD